MCGKTLPGNFLCALTLAGCLFGCASQPSRQDHSGHRGSAATARAHDNDDHDDDDDATISRKIARVKIGMTKAQVIAIMDDEGEEGGISRSAQGTMETLHFHPGYGSRYVSALKSGYTFGMAGRAGRQGATVSFRNGRVMHINSY